MKANIQHSKEEARKEQEQRDTHDFERNRQKMETTQISGLWTAIKFPIESIRLYIVHVF